MHGAQVCLGRMHMHRVAREIRREKNKKIAIRADPRVTDCVTLFLVGVSLNPSTVQLVVDYQLWSRKRYAKTWRSRVRVQIPRLTTSLNLSQHLTSLKPANKLSAARFPPSQEYSIFFAVARVREYECEWNENYTGT